MERRLQSLRAPHRGRPILRPSFPALSATLLAATTLAACRPQTSAAEEAEAAGGGVRRREVTKVFAGEIERREMLQILETTSKLESENEIQLFARVPGIAVEVLAEEGDEVQRDTVLARLDAQDEALAVRDAEVAEREAQDSLVLAELAVEEAASRIQSAAQNARQAERDYERDRRLAESTSVASPLSEQALETKLLARDNALVEEAQAKIAKRRSELELESAKTALKRAEVALEQARLNLSYKEIVAPFDGVVAQRMIRLGANVGAGEPAFVLTDTTSLRAVFARPQEELALFAGAQAGANGTYAGANGGPRRLSIQATAEAYPGREFAGFVERISPTIDPDSGQFRVFARLTTSKEADEAVQLLPGMLVRMQIVTDRHPDALVVPKRALRREGERRFLLRVNPGAERERTLSRVEIREGYRDEEYVEIMPLDPEALDAGDVVVVVGSRDLEEGDSVELEVEGADAAALASTPAEPEPEPDAVGAQDSTASALESETSEDLEGDE